MKKRLFSSPYKGFTLTEIVIAAAVISIILAFSLVAYHQYSEKAKKAEAVVTISNIRQAEEFNKQQTGTYVAAENTEAVNQALNLTILPKYYEYQVVGVTDDNFIVLARRIGSRIEDYLSADRLPPDDIVMAIDKTGAARKDYTQYVKKRSDEGGGSGGGKGGSRSTGGGSGSGGGSGGGGGSASGGKKGGDSGDRHDDSVTLVGVSEPVYTDEVLLILDRLRNSDAGRYYYDLIIQKVISVVFKVFALDFPQLPVGVVAFWAGKTDNTIYLNTLLSEISGPEAIACTVCHEATHADYSYHPQKWIDSTLGQHPELSASDLHITTYPLNSIDQEYNCFKNSVLTWKDLKGTLTDPIMDDEEAKYDQGEEYMKAQIRLTYADQMLPEY